MIVPATPTIVRGLGQRRGGRQDVVEVVLDEADGVGELLGLRWVVEELGSVRRTLPTSSDTTASGSVDADRELGGAAADVEDQERARAGSSSAVAPRKPSRASSSPSSTSTGDAERLAGFGQEVVAVGRRRAATGGGHRPDAGDPVLVERSR